MRNVRTPKGAARAFIRGIQAAFVEEQVDAEIERLGEYLSDLAVCSEMESHETNDEGLREASDWIGDVADILIEHATNERSSDAPPAETVGDCPDSV